MLIAVIDQNRWLLKYQWWPAIGTRQAEEKEFLCDMRKRVI
jgi:hypothetical protein